MALEVATIAALVLALGYLVLNRGRGDLSGADARSLVKGGALLLDVRTPQEYAGGHLPASRAQTLRIPARPVSGRHGIAVALERRVGKHLGAPPAPRGLTVRTARAAWLLLSRSPRRLTMANITVRKGNGGQFATQAPAQEWDPIRWMRDMLRWDPFQQMAPAGAAEDVVFVPAFEIKENKDGFTFKADVPGVKQEDIEVTATGNRLRVSGRRESEHVEKTDTFYACERSYGSFVRNFTLPEGADTEHIRAELEGGVLTIAIPRRPELQPRKIAVKSDKSKS